MKIIGLDLAGTSGMVTIDGDGKLLDLQTITLPKGYLGQRLRVLASSLEMFFSKQYPFEFITCEESNYCRNQKTARTLHAYRAMAIHTAWNFRYQVNFYEATAARKAVLGENKGKEELKAFLSMRYGVSFTQDEADALACALTLMKEVDADGHKRPN